ncbi:hypothetical protein B7486_65615, partial [cyanobacterium TDX16]
MRLSPDKDPVDGLDHLSVREASGDVVSAKFDIPPSVAPEPLNHLQLLASQIVEDCLVRGDLLPPREPRG